MGNAHASCTKLKNKNNYILKYHVKNQSHLGYIKKEQSENVYIEI